MAEICSADQGGKRASDGPSHDPEVDFVAGEPVGGPYGNRPRLTEDRRKGNAQLLGRGPFVEVDPLELHRTLFDPVSRHEIDIDATTGRWQTAEVGFVAPSEGSVCIGIFDQGVNVRTRERDMG